MDGVGGGVGVGFDLDLVSVVGRVLVSLVLLLWVVVVMVVVVLVAFFAPRLGAAQGQEGGHRPLSHGGPREDPCGQHGGRAPHEVVCFREGLWRIGWHFVGS